MWIVLAVVSFLAGQIYLFHCLGKLDQFLNAQNEEKKILSVALADPIAEEHLSRLLETYSIGHPDVNFVIYIDPKVMDAVQKGKADVGFCRLSEGWRGPNSLTLSLPGAHQQQVIWKNNEKVGEFVQYLWLSYGK